MGVRKSLRPSSGENLPSEYRPGLKQECAPVVGLHFTPWFILHSKAKGIRPRRHHYIEMDCITDTRSIKDYKF